MEQAPFSPSSDHPAALAANELLRPVRLHRDSGVRLTDVRPCIHHDEGRPGNSTSLAIFYIYQQAFLFNEYGYAAAMASVLVVVLMAITVLMSGWPGAGASPMTEATPAQTPTEEDAAQRAMLQPLQLALYLAGVILAFMAIAPLFWMLSMSLKPSNGAFDTNLIRARRRWPASTTCSPRSTSPAIFSTRSSFRPR